MVGVLVISEYWGEVKIAENVLTPGDDILLVPTAPLGRVEVSVDWVKFPSGSPRHPLKAVELGCEWVGLEDGWRMAFFLPPVLLFLAVKKKELRQMALF